MTLSNSLTIAVFQLNMTANIDTNKDQIASLVSDNQAKEADCWAFPECALFRPQSDNKFQDFSLKDIIITWFQDLANQHQKWILVGSFFYNNPDMNGTTNTSVLIDPKGTIQQHYDKMHLFDVNIESLSFLESKRFIAGTAPKTAKINNFLCGFSICFDLRFPELYRYYASQKAHLCFVPSSFTTATGTHHWHTLCRTRAIENQCYIIAPNQCGVGMNGAATYGHSLIIDPFGKILAEASADKPEVISATLSLTKLNHIRKLFPLLTARKL